MREAVLNAVAHRDYSPYVRGSYIQVRLFADRLEVQSPGGLYGNVTEENLEEESSTRNSVLMRLMEDLHLVENRGSGIRAMLEAMRRANLEPPRFEDKRSSFWVTFRNHTLMSPEAITWLNQFAGLPLNDRQRLALVYLRYNDQITNSDYQRLNQVDALAAGRELRGLVQAGLVEQESARRWTYYTLRVSRELPEPAPAASDEERILSFAGKRGRSATPSARPCWGSTANGLGICSGSWRMAAYSPPPERGKGGVTARSDSGYPETAPKYPESFGISFGKSTNTPHQQDHAGQRPGIRGHIDKPRLCGIRHPARIGTSRRLEAASIRLALAE